MVHSGCVSLKSGLAPLGQICKHKRAADTHFLIEARPWNRSRLCAVLRGVKPWHGILSWWRIMAPIAHHSIAVRNVVNDSVVDTIASLLGFTRMKKRYIGC